MKHPNELDEQIEHLRTLQQSYDQIATAAEAYNVGKTQLAESITSKGVETSPTESYPEMAEKVNAISQETYEIQGGEMYAKQLFGSLEAPNYWNLYEVLANLLSDGRLVSYGGILLAEYYKGYTSLALAGAGAGGAYVVSDKDENGQFKMYTEDTTHTWSTEPDGKGNRWVAYCFADEYHTFQITNTNTSPRSIFIGRKVGKITSLVNGRVSKVVVPDGNKLKAFSSTGNSYSQNWDKNLVFKNLEAQDDYLYRGAKDTNVESLYIQADRITNGVCWVNGGGVLQSVILDCPTVSGTLVYGGGGAIGIVFNVLIMISPNSIYMGRDGDWSSLKELSLVDAESATLYSQNGPITTASSIQCPVSISYKENDKTKSVNLTYYSSNIWARVPDVNLKDGWCKPLNVAACAALTEENMYAHILQRLKQDEENCGAGVTITLGSTNLAKLTSDESQDLLALLRGTYGYTFA